MNDLQKLQEIKKIIDDILTTEPTDEELDYNEEAIQIYADLHNLQESLESYGIGGSMEKISKERVVQILQNYVDNDLGAAEPSYVRDVLVDVCGCDNYEMKELGFEYLIVEE